MTFPKINQSEQTKPLQRLPVRLLLAMEALSSLVNQLFQLLLPWYILASTGSVMWMAVSAFATIAPGIFSSLWGGSIIDRIGRAVTMLVCELCQLVILTAIPVLIITGNDKPLYISALIFLSAFFDAPAQLARDSLMPTYSRYAAIPLHRTMGLKEAINGINAVAGPIAGGIIISLYGALKAWVIACALCFLIVFTALFLYNNRKRVFKRPNATTYADAWGYMKGDKFLLQVILFTLPLFILGESWELLILPTYVHTFGHTPMFLGLLEAAFGLGAFIGAVYFAAAGKRINFFTLLIINYGAYILSITVLMYNLPGFLVTAATFLSGLPFGAFSANVITIILSRAQEQVRAKTLALFTAGAAFTESVFVLLIGLLLQTKGLFTTLALAAAIFTLLIILSFFIRKQDIKPQNPAPAK